MIIVSFQITIDSMIDEYEAVSFPHRRIIHKLVELIKGNKIAETFHGEKSTLCMGCHHNSPASMEPPKCASCHGEPFKSSEDGRPGLKGAFHVQCITCHQKMDIKEPAATECLKCHKKRDVASN